MTQPWRSRNEWAECRKILALHSNILLLPNTVVILVFWRFLRLWADIECWERFMAGLVLRRWAYEQNSHLSFQCAHYNYSQLMAILNTLVLDTDSQYPW